MSEGCVETNGFRSNLCYTSRCKQTGRPTSCGWNVFFGNTSWGILREERLAFIRTSVITCHSSFEKRNTKRQTKKLYKEHWHWNQLNCYLKHQSIVFFFFFVVMKDKSCLMENHNPASKYFWLLFSALYCFTSFLHNTTLPTQPPVLFQCSKKKQQRQHKTVEVRRGS